MGKIKSGREERSTMHVSVWHTMAGSHKERVRRCREGKGGGRRPEAKTSLLAPLRVAERRRHATKRFRIHQYPLALMLN